MSGWGKKTLKMFEALDVMDVISNSIKRQEDRGYSFPDGIVDRAIKAADSKIDSDSKLEAITEIIANERRVQ